MTVPIVDANYILFNDWQVMSWIGLEFIYMAASPPCRAVWMCIKELGIEVDMRQIDMYKKAEHTQPWFVKVCIETFSLQSFSVFICF